MDLLSGSCFLFSKERDFDPTLLNPSRPRNLERTWSFDSNRELVERDLSHSEDEDEKGSLQVGMTDESTMNA
jgi:hypothetical protein